MVDYKCPVCGNVIYSSAPLLKVKCQSCGCEFEPAAAQQPSMPPQPHMHVRGVFDEGPSGKCRGVAALLAIFLGCFGVHYFYLGKNTAGIIFLLITLLSCGIVGVVIEILALVQGILMFTMTEEDFENRYIYSTTTLPF